MRWFLSNIPNIHIFRGHPSYSFFSLSSFIFLFPSFPLFPFLALVLKGDQCVRGRGHPLTGQNSLQGRDPAPKLMFVPRSNLSAIQYITAYDHSSLINADECLPLLIPCNAGSGNASPLENIGMYMVWMNIFHKFIPPKPLLWFWFWFSKVSELSTVYSTHDDFKQP